MSSEDPFGNPDENYHYVDPWFPRAKAHRLSKTVILSAVASLSVVIVVVIALHLYSRRTLLRQARRRADHLRLTVTRAGTEEEPKRGLAPMVIASLPVILFRHRDGDDDTALATECSVCLSTMENNEMARFLLNCKHLFHAECLEKWLSSHSTCPICRTDADPRVQPEPREAPAGPADGAAPSALTQIVSGLP